MVFPGLLASNGRNPSSSKSRERLSAEPPNDYIFDEAQLPRLPTVEPDLRDLNNCLEALATVFPDIQIEVFRELLGNFDGESRLALVADGILKNRTAWVKGRWRVIDKQQQQPTTSELVPKSEKFRSQEYKKAVETLAWSEFKGLYKSTVKAVLAENNYSYLEARRTLVALSSKSWRFTIANLFTGKRLPASGEAENHPLVLWRSTGQGSITPTIRRTGCPELDRELYDTLIGPLRRRDKEERESKDRCLAALLNNEEAEEAGATYECSCCYTTGPFEEFTHCNTEGHMICFRCVQHSIKEALFGQGWLSSIDAQTGTLKCIAADGSDCHGHISSEHIRRAMLEEAKGAEMLHKLDQRLAEHSLIASKLPLVRCPFCNYAEIDDIYMPSRESLPRIKLDSVYSLALLALCFGSAVLPLPLVLLFSLACIAFSLTKTFGHRLLAEWRMAMARHRRRRRGLKFSCQSPDCGRVSCLSCSKSWADIHICNESSLVALRTQIEQAMSMAIKRVCPRCNTSFVKNAGCNKLTCPCGYKMCYVCRSDLGSDGYRHFCDHFRPDGDPRPCTECDRCNLWESEDTDRVLQAAREEAERKWKSSEKRDLSGEEKSFLETGYATREAKGAWHGVLLGGRVPSLAQVLDVVVETIFL